MKSIRIELEVELPDNYKENEVDEALADTIYDLGGQLIESKEYMELTP